MFLGPDDDPNHYQTLKGADGRLQLAKGETGNCVYLTKQGCGIHGRAPKMCQVFDCRLYALQKRGQAEKGLHRLAVIAEGEKRLPPSMAARYAGASLTPGCS